MLLPVVGSDGDAITVILFHSWYRAICVRLLYYSCIRAVIAFCCYGMCCHWCMLVFCCWYLETFIWSSCGILVVIWYIWWWNDGCYSDGGIVPVHTVMFWWWLMLTITSIWWEMIWEVWWPWLFILEVFVTHCDAVTSIFIFLPPVSVLEVNAIDGIVLYW